MKQRVHWMLNLNLWSVYVLHINLKICNIIHQALLWTAKQEDHRFVTLHLSVRLFVCLSMSKHDFLAFDLDLWPTTLTYNPNLAKVKVDPHAEKSRSNGSKRRARTNIPAHRRTEAAKLPERLPDHWWTKLWSTFVCSSRLQFLVDLLISGNDQPKCLFCFRFRSLYTRLVVVELW